jgi:uncharacterized iron-regulated membrane protein
VSTRTWFQVHSFTGVITGLMLFVICWSGTFAVLAHEIDWLVTPEARAKVEGAWASWGNWLAAVQVAYPGAEVLWLEAPRYPASTAVAVVDLPYQDLVRVYIEPHGAEILGHGSYYTVQRFFRNLHMSLFMGDVGIYVVSAFSLTMLTSLGAALMFYRRWWRRFFRLPRGRGRAFWSELHKSSGLWSIWFLLLITITGAWYLFEIARYDFLDGLFSFAGTDASAVHQVPTPNSFPDRSELSLDSLIDRVHDVRPDLEIRTISPAFSHEGVLYVNGQTGHVLLRDRANQIHLDVRTGEVLYDQNASDYPLYWRWSDTADPLHFGDFGGLWSKGVWFVFGLALSGLILSGTWLHAHRLARGDGAKARHRWPGTFAAITVSLALLAASVSFGFQQAQEAYGPMVDGVKQLPTVAPGVRAVIIGWVALTLGIIAAWVVLLWRPQTVLQRNSESLPNIRRHPKARTSEGGIGE